MLDKLLAGMSLMDEAPTGLPLHCAATLDRDGICLILTFQNAPILGPRSGVSYSSVFGGCHFLAFGDVAYACSWIGSDGTSPVSSGLISSARPTGMNCSPS